MLTIYLTRHGETQWNIENRLQGSMDSELTEKGISDTKFLSKKLSEIEINKIYSSPSKRAVKTAEIIRNNSEVLIIELDGLKEINFGEWEGKTKSEINEGYLNKFSSLWDSPHTYDHIPHRGESLNDFIDRVENVMAEILRTNDFGNVLIVTHAVVLATIVAYFKKASIENLWDLPYVHGTSLTIIELDDESKLQQFKLLCDMSHLEY